MRQVLKPLFLFFLLMNVIVPKAQDKSDSDTIYCDKSFYLLDSLEISKVTKNDFVLIDSILKKYHSETDDTIKKSDGSYDLLNNVWDNKADKKDVKVPYTYVLEIAKFFMSGIDERFAEYNRDKTDYELYKSLLQDENIESDKKEIEKIIETKEQEIKSDLDALYVAKHMVRSFRVEAFEKDDDEENEFLIDIKIPNADYSVNNMVYKIIERYGYLDRLVEVLKERDNYKD